MCVFPQELMSRTSLETQKLDLMDEVSSLKLKLVSMEETHSDTQPQDSVDTKQNKAEVWNKPVGFCLFHCTHVAQLSKIRNATAASQIQGLTNYLYQCAIRPLQHLLCVWLSVPCKKYMLCFYYVFWFPQNNTNFFLMLGTYTWLQMLNLLSGWSAVLSEDTCLFTLDF